MNKIRIRFSFLFKLVAFLAVLGVVLFFVHRYQVSKQTEFLLKRAREAAEATDPTDAIRYYTQYTSVRKDDAQARVELAELFQKFGASERAFFYYEEALRIDPSLIEVRRSIVDAALAIGREKDARDQIVGHLLKTEPENADLHWKLGICEERLGDFSAAKKHYEKAIELNQSEPKYAVVYAELLARKFNQSRNARAALDQMVSQADKDPMAFISRGEWLLRERSTLSQGSGETRDQFLETAWQDAKAALDLKPDDPAVASFFSSVAVEKKEFELARAAIQSVMDQQPDNPRLYTELARIELGLGDVENAIAALQKGLAANPGDFDLLWTETQLQLDMGRMPEVERLISEMKSRINRPEALTLISYLDARVLANQGKWQEAASLLEQFRSQFDRAQGILKQVDFVLATCYRNLGNSDQELASLRRCINSDPLFTPARDALAVALFRAGKVQEALSEYGQISAQSNPSPAMMLNYARVLFLDGLSKNAKDVNWNQLQDVLSKLDSFPEIADDVAILRAELLLNQSQRDEAEKLIAARLKESNKSPQLHQALISIRSLNQDWDQVRLALKEAGEALGDTVALRLERARFLLRRDGDQVDKQQLDQLANPNDEWDDSQRSELAMGFAALFLSLRDMDRATKLATSVAESPAGQTDLTSHMMLFDIASMTDNSELMAQSLKKVKEIDRTGAVWRVGDAIRLNLAAKKVKETEPKRASQLYQEAIRQLTEAAVIRPAWSRIPRLKGEIYDEQENADSALESYVEAINRGDYAPEVVSRTLSMLLEKGRFLEADNIIRKTQDQKSPVSSELSRMASQIYMQMQDYDRAVDVARNNANKSDSQEDHLLLAQVYAATDRDAEAEQEFRTSIAKDPSAPAPWVTLIQFYARQQNREAALLALADAESQIRESDRDNALAQAHQSLGDLQNADKYYQAALAKTPDNPGVLRRYAEFLLLAGAPRLAEPILTKLITPEIAANDIDRAWGRRSLALIIGLRGNDEAVKQARELLNANAIKTGVLSVEEKRVLARVLERRSDARSTDEAVELLRDITQNAAKFSL
ncbi:MAG: tetratricopeptide repeat protein, partial [Pirellula sp.]|nr:tetratricopeptide repeat protein [Pirellula sp.]